MNKLKTFRQNYYKATLDKVCSDPFEQFEIWLQDAYDDGDVLEPNAMTVCTVNSDGQPSARILLLRNFSEDGFEFYTNYNSQKGKELEQNKKAALCFFWEKLERQVRVEGEVEKLSKAKSDFYFNSRPVDSRISAIVSEQSKVASNREEIERRVFEFKNSNQEISRPQNWGGYILKPNKIEFWQGRANRLHDRMRYLQSDGIWTIERLYP